MTRLRKSSLLKPIPLNADSLLESHSHMSNCVAVVVDEIRVGSETEEESNDSEVLLGDSDVQRRVPVRVLGIDITAKGRQC